MTIQRAAVLGAGVMGAQIAAHLANAGLEVRLLDLVPEGADDRDVLAKKALERLATMDPPPLMSRRFARRIMAGNVEDDLPKLAEADWILEAVVEQPEEKRRLYARILEVMRPDAIVTSNTSTIPLHRLVAGLPAAFARRFAITHFFNPPRYMRLLELVAGPQTEGEVLATLAAFCDHRLGKSVVLARDTPGFIANRIGAFWIQASLKFALALGLAVEEADAVIGRPLGFPRTGIFGLIDLVGLDLVPQVDASLARALPPDDPYHAVRAEFPLLAQLVAEGYRGRKGKGGFYRRREEDGRHIREVVDLATGTFRPLRRVAFESLELAKSGDIALLLEHGDRAGRYARAVLTRTIAYAARLLPEIADEIEAVDRAMRTGYGWRWGPFELADRLGAGRLCALCAREGVEVPPLLERAAAREGFYRLQGGRLEQLAPAGDYRPLRRPQGVLLLEDIRRASAPLAENGAASLWDLGDGVVVLEVHTKMNTIDPEVLDILARALELVPRQHRALVIYNEGEHFSAGANIGLALFAANVGAWSLLEELVEKGQRLYAALRTAPFPVVAAPSGLALGGGCELLLAADRVVAHAESYVGLVECGVGLLPAWGGCTRLLARYAADPDAPRGPMPPVMRAFETIGRARVARSAVEARELGFLTAEDEIVMNRDRLLAAAKAKALALARDYRPPGPVRLALPGPTGRAALAMALRDLDLRGALTPHDHVVAEALAGVLSGGEEADFIDPVDEGVVMARERAAFMRLIRTEATLERMEHTLETGRPLRN